MRITLLVLAALFISSCSKDDNSSTFVSGLIQNPTHDHIYLSNGEDTLDTIQLKPDGSFEKKINIDTSKFMVFEHPPEYQTLFVKPGDSLAFRLNTLDFDKSLVFSGNSSKENNFMMDMYLMNESNSNLVSSHFKKSPDFITKKTDSIKNERLSRLKELDRQNNFSENFLEIAKKYIDYEVYDIKERYAFLLKKHFPEKAEVLNDSFYQYRKSADFNNVDLANHFGYLRFLDDYLKNKSLDRCLNNENTSVENCFDLNSFSNIHHRLELANSIFKNQKLKTKFLERFFANELLYATRKDQFSQAISLLKSTGISDDKKEKLRKFSKFHKKFLVGQKVDKLALRNHNKNATSLNKLSDKPYTAIHIWSCNMPEANKQRFDLINKMRKQYDHVSFIGINTNHENYKLWQQDVTEYDLMRNHELQTPSTEDSKYYKHYLNRFTLIDASGQIIAANVIDSEKEIKKFIADNTGIN